MAERDTGGSAALAPERQLAEPRDRGWLEIHPVVVERIVRRTVLDQPDVIAGRTGALNTRRSPHVRSSVTRGRADVQVNLALAWGVPLGERAVQIQAAVAEQIRRLTGLEVNGVEVVVDDVQLASEERVR